MPYKNLKKRRAYARAHYKANPAKYKANALKYTIAQRKKLRQYSWGYRSQHSCVDCGESDPVVLQFDHRRKYTKRAAIADCVSNAVGLVYLKTEIAKCDVRCANCHLRKTSSERKYFTGKSSR